MCIDKNLSTMLGSQYLQNYSDLKPSRDPAEIMKCEPERAGALALQISEIICNFTMRVNTDIGITKIHAESASVFSDSFSCGSTSKGSDLLQHSFT